MLSKENLLEIVNISVDAGKVILNYYNENVDVIYKDDESPLTKADLASHKIITDSIKKMCTTIDVIKLMEPEDIFPAYEKAFTRTDGRNTLIVEFGDYYNEK